MNGGLLFNFYVVVVLAANVIGLWLLMWSIGRVNNVLYR